MNIFRHIRRIERSAYPEHMRYLQHVRSTQDLADYMECQSSEVRVFSGEGWYMLVAEHGNSAEVVDLAALPGKAPSLFVVAGLLSKYDRLYGDTRDTTSHRIVLLLSRRYGFAMTRDEVWDWDGETMHEFVLERMPAALHPEA